MSATRPYDVVLYGATGFTGRQTVEHFRRHAGPELRWAIAGRDATRLTAMALTCPCADGTPRPVIVCDSTDPESAATMAASTRVLLSTVGPYLRYGTPIVEACVDARTHYVDITGETAWVRDLIDRFHDTAAANGTRIVPFCGFDSVPSDLGAFIAVEHLRRVHGTGTRSVRAFHRGRGGINGGTIASFLNMAEGDGATRMRDPLLLNPPELRGPARPDAEADPVFPHYDRSIGALVAPFVMSPINTRVVRRSAALAALDQAPWGDRFSYQEYWKCEGLMGPVEAATLSWGQALFPLLTGLAPVRRALAQLVPAPGTGPSEATMDNGFFRCELLAEGDGGQRIRVVLSDSGDPGNRATVKMLCECALALAEDEARLPGGAGQGGILTPASAFGLVLRDRLEGRGMTIRVDDPIPA